MSRVYEPVRVEVTGSHGYGYGLAIHNPRKTRTRDTGLTGLMDVTLIVTTRLGRRVHFSPVPPPHLQLSPHRHLTLLMQKIRQETTSS